MNHIDEICKQLLETYDANVLDHIYNDDIINSFKNITYEYIHSNLGNKSLINIIYNKYYNKLSIFPKYISGLSKITYFKSDRNIKIYCLEYDNNLDSSNMNIIEYLNKVFKHTTRHIDFYIENGIYENELPTVVSEIETKYKSSDIHKKDLIPVLSRTQLKTLYTCYKYNIFLSWKKTKKLGRFLNKVSNLDMLVNYIFKLMKTMYVIQYEINLSIFTHEFITDNIRDSVKNMFQKNFLLFKIKKIDWTKKSKDKSKRIMNILKLLEQPLIEVINISRVFNRTGINKHVIFYGKSFDIFNSFISRIGFKKQYERYKNRERNVININFNFI